MLLLAASAVITRFRLKQICCGIAPYHGRLATGCETPVRIGPFRSCLCSSGIFFFQQHGSISGAIKQIARGKRIKGA